MFYKGDNPAIGRAMAAVAEAIPHAEVDSTRPVYHFRPPSQLMSDPNGPIYYKGWYHLFYQFNPYSNEFPPLPSSPGGEWKWNWHWGHAKSRDLVHWEHLPIALWPSREKGEEHCASGCTVVNDRGQPMILYTSMGTGNSYIDKAQQWAALACDDDLVIWEKYQHNPIIPESVHGNLKIYQWRDLFVFKNKERTFLVMGGKLGPDAGNDAVVLLYEAKDGTLTQWKYCGILFRHPDKNLISVEVPSFLRLGDKWVLITNSYRIPPFVEWYIGDFDIERCMFTVESNGIVDGERDCFYAGTVFSDGRGRQILLGCISRGYLKGTGWHGCLSLPRVLSLGEHGELLQDPIPELETLRGKHVEVSDVVLGTHVIKDIVGDTLEIHARVNISTAKVAGIRLRPYGKDEKAVDIRYDGGWIKVNDAQTPLRLLEGEKTLDLRVFLDKRVVEVFANRRACVTQVIEPGRCGFGVEVFAEGGKARLSHMDLWEIIPVWQ